MSLFRQHSGSTLYRLRLLKTKRVCVYIHKITTADPPNSWPHDHGCDFISIGLSGWYSEALYDEPRRRPERSRVIVRGPRHGHRMRNAQAHRILHLSGPAVYTCSSRSTTCPDAAPGRTRPKGRLSRSRRCTGGCSLLSD